MTIRRILSLDGGGIRGLISAIWLESIEAELARQGKGPLRDHFDLLAGTSTGALQACAIAHGFAASDLIELYREQGPKIFPGRARRLWSRLGRLAFQGPSAPKYDGKGLDRTLKRTFEDTVFSDLLPRVLAVTYDVVRRAAIFFKSWKEEHQAHLVRDVCRAPASAPTYFAAHRMKVERMHRGLIDGGVVANSPAACAIAEALRLNGEGASASDLVVLSLGTGEAVRSIGAE